MSWGWACLVGTSNFESEVDHTVMLQAVEGGGSHLGPVVPGQRHVKVDLTMDCIQPRPVPSYLGCYRVTWDYVEKATSKADDVGQKSGMPPWKHQYLRARMKPKQRVAGMG